MQTECLAGKKTETQLSRVTRSLSEHLAKNSGLSSIGFFAWFTMLLFWSENGEWNVLAY